jgi:hypothetical protein
MQCPGHILRSIRPRYRQRFSEETDLEPNEKLDALWKTTYDASSRKLSNRVLHDHLK